MAALPVYGYDIRIFRPNVGAAGIVNSDFLKNDCI